MSRMASLASWLGIAALIVCCLPPELSRTPDVPNFEMFRGLGKFSNAPPPPIAV